MLSKKVIVAAIMLIFVLALAIASSILTVTQQITSTGQIITINLTANPTSINWGTIDPGTSVTSLVSLTNTGNAAETLTMSTTNLPSYLTLSWNCTNYSLSASGSCYAMFTLTVSPSSTLGAAFNFVITITGTAP